MSPSTILHLRAALDEAAKSRTADEKLAAIEKALQVVLREFEDQERACQDAANLPDL